MPIVRRAGEAGWCPDPTDELGSEDTDQEEAAADTASASPGPERCGRFSKRGTLCGRIKGTCPYHPVDKDGNPLEPIWGTVFECEYECGFESRKQHVVERHELTCEKKPRKEKAR